jgi:hypothetical protein
MRKLLGKLGRAIVRPFLNAAMLFLLISPAICHAEHCSYSPGYPSPSSQWPSISSISPGTWYAGQTYNVIVTGFFPGNQNPYAPDGSVIGDPGCQYIEFWADTSASFSFVNPGVPIGDVDPSVIVNNYFDQNAYISATQTMMSVTIAANAPTETDYVIVTCDGCDYRAYAPVQIVGCTTPTITAIKPSTWFAGKTYKDVKITGTNFTTQESAAKTSCPETPVTITAADGSAVPVPKVHVDSDTQITVTVKPPASDPTESATVTAGPTPAISNTQTYTAQILGNQIQCDPSMNCTQSVISTTDGSTPPVQSVVVGQPIILTTNPNLPATIKPTNPTWTVGGTNIGSFKSSIKGFKTKDTVLNKPTTTFYWLSQGTGIPVTYQYCVNIPGVGNQCGPTATATFNVSAPSSVNLYTCGGDVTGCSQYGPLGSVAITPGPKLSLGNSPTNIGIVFNASDDPSSPPGTFSFVQVIGNYYTTYSYKNGRSCPFNFGFGLDNSNPYPPDSDTIADDNPDTTLYADDAEVTADMTATMYLLWTSSVAGSIPVPLGYLDWSWFGDAIQDESTKTWSIKLDSGSQGYAGSFQDSSTYPQWPRVISNHKNNTCAH